MDELSKDLSSGNLAQVVYVDPSEHFLISEHPPEDVTVGEAWTKTLMDAIMSSSSWSSTAIFLTWDEAGGFYDHAPPPQVDHWGYGFRVPMIVVSPYAKRGFVDHDTMDHTSILKFIADNWQLPYLNEREARAGNLTTAFEFIAPSGIVPRISPASGELAPAASREFGKKSSKRSSSGLEPSSLRLFRLQKVEA